MNIFEKLKKKQKEKAKERRAEIILPTTKGMSWKKIESELSIVSKSFFPEKVVISPSLFKKPTDLRRSYFACNTRNTSWLVDMLEKDAKKLGLKIDKNDIRRFVLKSSNFNSERENFESRIVAFILNGIIKKDAIFKFNDDSQDFDVNLRSSISQNLRALGFSNEMTEKLIERNADIWKNMAMNVTFDQSYNSFVDPLEIDYNSKHREIWILNREYAYYIQYKESVDKFGRKTPGMQMSKEQFAKNELYLNEQEKLIRQKVLQEAEYNDKIDSIFKN